MIALLLAGITTRKPTTPAPSPARPTTLDRARKAQKLLVLEIAGSREVANSLAQLGIRVGESLRVKRAAPLGGAVLVETGERSVALGRALARKVKVQFLP